MKVHIVQSKSTGVIYGVFSTKELAEKFLYNCEHPRISVTEHDVIGWVGPTSSVTITPLGQQIVNMNDNPPIPLFGDIFLSEEHRKAHEEHFKKKEEG